MAAISKMAAPCHVKWRNFLFPHHKYLCNSTFLGFFWSRKSNLTFSNSKWVPISQIQNGCHFLKWPLFCKMAAIFQNGYPLTCKMEKFPFNHHRYYLIYVLALFEFFLVKEAKFDIFEFKMAPNFFKMAAIFKMAAP